MANDAKAQVDIAAPASEVWKALTDPELIKKYMMGSEVTTDWQPGSPITWKGEYDGKDYEDKGMVLDVVPEERLQVTHYSPLSGQPDAPENYHTVTYELESSDDATTLRLSQGGCGSDKEAEQFSENWQQMLDGLKAVVEN